MLKKLLNVVVIFSFAFAILSLSILKSAAVNYNFTAATPENNVLGAKSAINYQFPYYGTVLPDSLLWKIKVFRDKVWYFITPSPTKKSELALLFADKRLTASKVLFEKKKPDLAVTTLTKGEKYLEIAAAQEAVARLKGMDTTEILTRLANASLKHREFLESLIPLAPEDARPFIIKTEVYSKEAFISARNGLNSKGLPVPFSPFIGD